MRVAALGFGGVGLGLVHRVDGEEVGPRAAARLVVDREHGRENGGRGRPDRRDRVKPTWLPRWQAGGRRRLCPRWTAAAFTGARRDLNGKRKHTGRRDGTRGSDSTARMRRRRSDGGGLRRRPSAAEKEGNRRWSTRVRLEAAGASPGLGELIPGVGWDGGVPSEAGDERRLPGTGGNRDETMPGGGGAWGFVYARSGGLPSYRASQKRERASEKGERRETLPSRDGRCDGRPTARGELSGLGPGKGKERVPVVPRHVSSHTPASPARATAEGGEVGERQRWSGGNGAVEVGQGNEEEREGLELGFIGGGDVGLGRKPT
jgi:hypothetical protein